jgi:hypothetical protein
MAKMDTVKPLEMSEAGVVDMDEYEAMQHAICTLVYEWIHKSLMDRDETLAHLPGLGFTVLHATAFRFLDDVIGSALDKMEEATDIDDASRTKMRKGLLRTARNTVVLQQTDMKKRWDTVLSDFVQQAGVRLDDA